MNLFDKFLNNKWIKKLINLLRSENKLLKAVNLDFIDKLAEMQKKTKRGRNKIYPFSKLFKLCVDAFQKGKTSAKAIERYVKEPLVKVTHEISGYVSHDVISRFFTAMKDIIKKIFYKLVREAEKLGMFYSGLTQVTDGTDLPTRFKKDKDAKWNYDSTSKKYYFGYGVLISIDPITHLPIAGKLTKGKKVNRQECKEVFDSALMLNPSAIIGDPEFDVIELIEDLFKKNVLLIAPYNKINSNKKLPIKFRSELYGFNRQWMLEEMRYRSEVEHTISTLKEHFHLLDFHVRGWEKVETHVFFVLCLRLLHGIATFKEGKNPRQVTLI